MLFCVDDYTRMYIFKYIIINYIYTHTYTNILCVYIHKYFYTHRETHTKTKMVNEVDLINLVNLDETYIINTMEGCGNDHSYYTQRE